MAYLKEIADLPASGTLTAQDQVVQIAMAGRDSCGCVLSGTWTATVVFEASCDSAVTWSRIWFTSISSDPVFAGIPYPIYSIAGVGTSGNGTYRLFNTTGVTHLRARALAYSTGTVSVTLTAVAAVPNFMFTNSAVIQHVSADANNSSTANLNSGNSYTFTGAGTSTLGVAGIQVTLKADQDCFVYVEQSPDNVYWDISDLFRYLNANGNFGVTVQAVNAYYRVRVLTASLTTNTFRLNTCLCPLVEAVPRALDHNQNLRIAAPVDGYGFEAENTPMGEQRFVTLCKLAGTKFEGTTVDSNFWNTQNYNSSSITQANSEVTLASGTNSLADSIFSSVRRAGYIASNAMRFRAGVQLVAGQTNNTRQWGVGFGFMTPTAATWTRSSTTATVTTTVAHGLLTNAVVRVTSTSDAAAIANGLYTITYASDTTFTFTCAGGGGTSGTLSLNFVSDGAFFQLSGTTFSVVTRKQGIDTVVSSGAFNGVLGPTYAQGTNINTYEIYWTNSAVWFVIGSDLLHKVSASTTPWAGTLSFYLWLENTNAGNTVDVSLKCRVISVSRMGPLLNQPISKYISSSVAVPSTTVLKRGSGNLHALIVGNVGTSGAVITLYDDVAATSGTEIGQWTFVYPGGGNFAPVSLDLKGLPFSTGLTIGRATQISVVTVVYE